MPVNAEVTAFVAAGEDEVFYQYSYNQLLDSFAMAVIGEDDGLYRDYSEKELYALLDCTGGYIDYLDVLDRFAGKVILGERFDLNAYTESNEAKRARMPAVVMLVALNDGKLVFSEKEITEDNPESIPDREPVQTRTPIIGAAGATVEQAQKWAQSREAHQRLIDIAPVYWKYGEMTGIRPEVLYAQSAIETNFGHFTGQVKPEDNNWAGIYKKESNLENEGDYESFTDPEDGVRGHFNHVIAYIGLTPVGEPHGRYDLVLEQPWAGTIEYIEELSGRWSPQADYHVYILSLLDQIKKTGTDADEPGDEEEEESTGDEPDEPEENEEKDEKSTPVPGNDSPAVESEYVVVDVSEITVLHLRSGPGTDYDIIDRLVRGTVLEVLGVEKEWLQVNTPDQKQGWVHGDYVKAVDLSINPFEGKLVALDPGHGGSDPGAIGFTGLKEKAVNLAVALHLQQFLEDAGAKVVMTRNGDQSVSNKKRVDVAKDAGADVFVSIHANAYSDPKSNGTETYYSVQNNSGDSSKYLAQQLQRELVSVLGLRDRGVKTANFYVISEAGMPAALVELAFLTNEEEEELFKDPETYIRSAEALFTGLEAYFRKHR